MECNLQNGQHFVSHRDGPRQSILLLCALSPISAPCQLIALARGQRYCWTYIQLSFFFFSIYFDCVFLFHVEWLYVTKTEIKIIKNSCPIVCRAAGIIPIVVILTASPNPAFVFFLPLFFCRYIFLHRYINSSCFVVVFCRRPSRPNDSIRSMRRRLGHGIGSHPRRGHRRQLFVRRR